MDANSEAPFIASCIFDDSEETGLAVVKGPWQLRNEPRKQCDVLDLLAEDLGLNLDSVV